MKKAFQFLIALGTVLWGGAALASQNWVMINLSEQRAYLVERGMVTLISPIASGKPGWSTPTGSFSILRKDIDHRSGSFGSVVDAAGRVVNSNATPASSVPRGCHFRPAPMPYSNTGIQPRNRDACGLPARISRIPRVRSDAPRSCCHIIFERVQVGTPVTVVGSARNLTRVRKPIPIFPKSSLVLGER